MPKDGRGQRPRDGGAPAAEGDTHRRIVTAAGDLFEKNGYTRCTTRAIAREAGVTEVTLFRHFASKESLFKAVMELFGSTYIVRSIESRLTGDYRSDLMMIGGFFLDMMLKRADRVALAICEARHFPGMRSMIAQIPAELWQVLARYLQGKMEEGVVRPLHTGAVAQSFFAAFYTYGLQRQILQLEPQPPISQEEFVAQIVDVFVKGTIAEGQEAVKP